MDNTKEHKKMKSTALKKHVAAEKYMANTKPERHTREDNINIKGSTCLWSACIVLLLLLNMYLSVRWFIYSLFNKTIIIKKKIIKIGAIYQINHRFGTNTLHDLQGHYLHIHCFTSLLKRFIISFLLAKVSMVGVHGRLGYLDH